MDRDAVSKSDTECPLFPPIPVLLAGVGMVVVSWIWEQSLPSALTSLRMMLLFLGLLTTGAGLAAYLPHARRHLDGRIATGGLFLLGAVSSYLGNLTLSTNADSLAFVLRLLAFAAVVAAVLTVLPTAWRYAVVSLLILFHIGVILVATTVVPPPVPPGGLPPWLTTQPEIRFGGGPPWLSVQIWTRYARSYLQFLQMNNAYHFYSPEPGPCMLTWFRVEFEDGFTRWTRFPDHPTCANHIERRRYGALATSLGQTIPVPVTQEMLEARERNGRKYSPAIPPAPEMPLPAQYQEPSPQVKLLIASYVRYIAKTVKHPQGKSASVRNVKVYRVEFHNPPVEQFQAGLPVKDPTLYKAWFQGNYDAQGTLAESSRDDLLYWLIPIVRTPLENAPPTDPEKWTGEGKLINYVRIHAGEPDQESVP